MSLDLDSLRKAVSSLERSLRVVETMAAMTPDLRETVQAGVIHHFEVAYESSWKFIQRWLHENSSPSEADSPRTRKDLFRMAARSGLLSDPTPWFGFGEARNLTSHTYDEANAEASLKAARAFLPYAQDLLKRLTERND